MVPIAISRWGTTKIQIDEYIDDKFTWLSERVITHVDCRVRIHLHSQKIDSRGLEREYKYITWHNEGITPRANYYGGP